MLKFRYGVVLFATVLFAQVSFAGFDEPSDFVELTIKQPLSSEIKISLESVVKEAVRRNTSVMADYLQTNISSEQVVSERSIYEPTLQSSFTSMSRDIQNSTDEKLTRLATDYHEMGNSFDLGISGILPTGAQWNIDFVNAQKNNTSIERWGGDSKYEYNSSLNLSIGQPLLKGFGTKVTEAKIDMATIQSSVDYANFEQKTMELIGVTIQVYWKLYGAQKIYNSWLDSIHIAEQSVADIEKRVAAGKLPETELLEAQDGLHQRKTELFAAASKVTEAQSQLFTLLNLSYPRLASIHLIAADEPQPDRSVMDLPYYLQAALDKWPEYQNAKRMVAKELTQVEYVTNQALPQLDFVGTFGTTSLDGDYDQSYRFLLDDEYVGWSTGLKFSMPLFGEGPAKSALVIAKLRLRQAEIQLDGLEKSLANSIYSKLDAVKSLSGQFAEYEKGLEIRTRLLATEREKLKAGRVSQRALLEQEEEFVHLQRKLVNCFINLKSAEAILQISSGDILDKYGVDLTSYSPTFPGEHPAEEGLPWE